MMKNKRAQFSVALAVAILILVAGIVAIISFVASSKLRYTLIGIFIFIMVVFLFTKILSSPKKTEKSTWIILLVLSGVAAFFILGSGYLQDVYPGSINYNTVYKADWGHVCCLAGPLETLAGPRYADDIKETSCSENVDKCELVLEGKSKVAIISNPTAEWKICNIDGSSCSGQIRQEVVVGNTYSFDIVAGKKAIFSSGTIFGDAAHYTWERKGAVYSLISEEDGKIFSGNTGSCFISDSLKRQVVAESPNPIPKGYLNCQNYLIGFIATATKTYSYNSQQVVCQARQLYSIDTSKMEDGNTVKLQGTFIKNVDCCPSEPNCGTDFKLHENNTRDCTYSTECPNGGNPIPVDQTTAKYFTCDSGTCVAHTKLVECTSDSVCQQRHGEGYVCDLSTQNYGTCKKSIVIFCGDGYCDIGESISSCPKDCTLKCKDNEKIVTTISKVNCVIGWPLNIGCDTREIQTCKSTKNLLPWILGGVIVLLVVGIYFISKSGRRRR